MRTRTITGTIKKDENANENQNENENKNKDKNKNKHKNKISPVKVRRPMQYASLSINVGRMLVNKQLWILFLLKYKGPLKVRMPMRLVCNITHCQFASVRCSYNEAIGECSRPILFRLKYDGPVIVRWPTQFVSLSIYVGQMFVKQQFWNVFVRSYSF